VISILLVAGFFEARGRMRVSEAIILHSDPIYLNPQAKGCYG